MNEEKSLGTKIMGLLAGIGTLIAVGWTKLEHSLPRVSHTMIQTCQAQERERKVKEPWDKHTCGYWY